MGRKYANGMHQRFNSCMFLLQHTANYRSWIWTACLSIYSCAFSLQHTVKKKVWIQTACLSVYSYAFSHSELKKYWIPTACCCILAPVCFHYITAISKTWVRFSYVDPKSQKCRSTSVIFHLYILYSSILFYHR